ncbi:MAG: insulinase family protein [bacterium]|nr:insulinase family protein [bacterium]
MKIQDLRGILPSPELGRLDNGLRICVIRNERVPLVATALVYRAGTRDDAAGHGGTAHFLEHMMFKGSRSFGPGDIDRLTRALGGSNNAFTSHDMTLYHFTFATDRWQQALDIEVDRMANLLLDPSEVDAERQVIVEEIAMYEGEPWDALELEVAAAFFRAHPYGRPVLGTREELAATDAAVLRTFHELHYRPTNAVLVVAGRVDGSTHGLIEERFGALHGPARDHAPDPDRAVERDLRSEGLVRIERRHGELARLLLALPAPAAEHPDHPLLRLLVGVLATGRSSRLHRALVDEGQLCVWVAAELNESVDPGVVSIASEVLPGIEPARVEEEILRQIDRLREVPPDGEEIARAKKILIADWIFGHEKVDQQALLAATALTLFDPEYPWRYLERLLDAGAQELRDAAERYLRPTTSGVLGWSLPPA